MEVMMVVVDDDYDFMDVVDNDGVENAGVLSFLSIIIIIIVINYYCY